MQKHKKRVFITLCCLLTAISCCFSVSLNALAENDDDYIKWVDFKVSAEMIKKVSDLDAKFRGSDVDFTFCEALAYLSVKNNNNFKSQADNKNLKKLVEYCENGGKLSEVCNTKYHKHFIKSYRAIFDGIFGDYIDAKTKEKKYGVCGFFPLASGFWYSHYDDFGSSRSYGYRRRHLGHDIMGGIGTPVIAIEGGTIAEMGWNQYGGWRIGIRSFDNTRYYYYAHLRKDKPFAQDLKLNDKVVAGQVIGFLGNTGYSRKENTNLKSGKPHLHVGLQLIFHESQIKGNKEIWVDLYSLSSFLSSFRAKVAKDNQTNEYVSTTMKLR